MKNLSQTICVLLFLLFTSCNNTGNNSFLPKPTGTAGEITVVMPSHHWDGELGIAFRDIFEKQQPGFYRREPMFDSRHLTPGAFSELFETKRNLFIFKIDNEKYKEPKIKILRDVWAQYQLVINASGPDKESLIAELLQNENRLIELLLEEERKRSVISSKKTLNGLLINKLTKEKNIRLLIPVGYKLFEQTDNFYWIGKERQENGTDQKQYLVIHTYNYVDSSTFTLDFLINKRNELMKKHIQGRPDSSYMTTDTIVPPAINKFYHNNIFTAEVRGSYKMVNGFLAGTFVNVSFLDETNNRVVMVEGFVYYPNNKHRNLLRQLESIIYTVEFTEPENLQKTD